MIDFDLFEKLLNVQIFDIISMVGDMITCNEDMFRKYCTALEQNNNMSDELKRHIIAVCKSCRDKYSY